MDTETLRVEWVGIDRLFCNPANPRLNDEAVPHVAASIQRFGWRQPVVAKPSGEVLAGNTRLKAARDLGLREVPVVWFEGSDLEATAYAIADNRTHEYAEATVSDGSTPEELARLLNAPLSAVMLEVRRFDPNLRPCPVRLRSPLAGHTIRAIGSMLGVHITVLPEQ